MENILEIVKYKCRVSSVLNRNSKEYGKTFLFDGQADTCWNSEQGHPQWIHLEFEQPVRINRFKLQFQGGFVGQDCAVQAGGSGAELADVEAFYPEDINSVQCFTLSKELEISNIRFVFHKSSDFFGRIIVYGLEIFS